MGIGINEFYVDFISTSVKADDMNEVIIYSEEQINQELFVFLKELLKKGELLRLEMSNTSTDWCMSVFCENGLSHFGIIDIYNETNYYYYDTSKNNDLISIDGQVFENKLVCNDNDLLWESIWCFACEGKCNPKINWLEE